jgi:pimeloyl-ACP methyl ester carboxylesterase
MATKLNVYGISGLGADNRVFKYLNLDNKLIPLDWIEPFNNEPIKKYAKRFAKNYKLHKEKEFIILGVSFGGLIATEISKLYKPKMTILISSVETKRELSKLIKLTGQTKIIKILPKQLLKIPKRIAVFVFGAEKRELLNSIIKDSDVKFTKWAINELANWNNNTKLENVLKIGGDKDKLLPPKDDATVIIKGGEHFMIVDKANEISRIINEQLKHITTQ